jgi:hypothetical protein
MSEVRATIEYYRTAAPERVTKITLDFQLGNALPGGVTYDTLAYDLLAGVTQMLTTWQKIRNVTFYNLVYNTLTKNWVTAGAFYKELWNYAGRLLMAGDKMPIGEGTIFEQLDDSGRKGGRFILKGNITESIVGDTNQNSYPVPAAIATGLANALNVYSDVVDSGTWGKFLPGGAHYAYAKLANYHGGKKGQKIGFINSITPVRTKQYRGVQPLTS